MVVLIKVERKSFEIYISNFLTTITLFSLSMKFMAININVKGGIFYLPY